MRVNHRALGFRSTDTLSDFLHDMKEIDETCKDLRARVNEVWRGLTEFSRNPTRLHTGAFRAGAGVLHLRWHMTRALRVLDRVTERTRQMPPLRQMSEREHNDLLFGELDRQIMETWHKARKRMDAERKPAKPTAKRRKVKKKRRRQSSG